MNRPTSRAPERILVICRPFLGDMVLTRPVFRNLRRYAPAAAITAAGYGRQKDLLSLVPEIDEALEVPRHASRGRLGLAADWRRFLAAVRRRRFDLVYDLMQNDRSAAITALSGAPVRLGFAHLERRLRHRVYTDTNEWTPEDLRSRHVVDLYLHPLERAGIPVPERDVRIEVTEAERREAAAIVAAAAPGGGGPLVIVHPGASSANKLWPVDELAAACDHLQEDLGARLLLVGGPAEAALLDALRSIMRTPPAVLDRTLGVRGLAAVLERGDLFFGHDSGPMHVAAAVGTPVVALFGAGSPVQWGPLGDGHQAVRPPMPCIPCAHPELCRPPSPYRMFCIRRLTQEEVRAALRAGLARVEGGKGGHPEPS